jgi:hypothetical protein
MPVIPTYEPGQVRNNPLNTPNVTADAFGYRDAVNLQRLGAAGNDFLQQAAALYRERLDEHDRLVVQSALNDATLKATHFLQNDVYSKSGSEALTAADKAAETLDKIGAESSSKLNQRQQALFGKAFAQLRTNNLESVIGFRAKAQEQYRLDTLSSGIESSIYSASQNPYNENYLHDTAIKVANMVEEQHRGRAPEFIEEQKRNKISEVYARAIATIADRDPAEALALAEKYKDYMAPEVHDKLAGALDQMVKKRSVENAAIQAVHGKVPGSEAADKTLDEMGVSDPVKREELKQTFMKAYMVEESKITEAERSQINEALDAILQDPRGAKVPESLPSDLQSKIARFQMNLLEGDRPTNYATFHKLLDMQQNDPAGFAKLKLEDYSSQLSNDHFRSLILAQMDTIKANGAFAGPKPPKQFRTESAEAQVRQAAKSIGLNSNGDEEDRLKYNAFCAYMDNVISQIPESERTQLRIDQEIKKAQTPVFNGDRTWWFTKKMIPLYMHEYLTSEYAVPEKLRGGDGEPISGLKPVTLNDRERVPSLPGKIKWYRVFEMGGRRYSEFYDKNGEPVKFKLDSLNK